MVKVDTRALDLCRIATGAALAALWAMPLALPARLPSVCIFKRLFGIECLGCGMTRAVCAALHGDLAAALACNRLVVVWLPLLAGFVVFPVFRIATRLIRHRPDTLYSAATDVH